MNPECVIELALLTFVHGYPAPVVALVRPPENSGSTTILHNNPLTIITAKQHQRWKGKRNWGA